MRRLLLAFVLALTALPAQAEVPLTGYFIAERACPALQSIRRETNPGNVMTSPGKAYDLLAGNTDRPSHFWIVIPGAEPDRRWVAVECGQRSTDSEARLPDPAPKPAPSTYRGTQYVLAINWQPAFCETSPNKPECRGQRPDSFEATHFTLHGLWPQPRANAYCNVSESERRDSETGNWRALPPLALNPAIAAELSQVMPGTMSNLERHEWTKHGTCFGTNANLYFKSSLDMLLAVNTSAVVDLFANNIGRKITLTQVRAAFDSSFGAGAGLRVAMACEPDGNRQIITELTIGLTGAITGPDDFASLILNASPVEGGCTSGMVDPVGLR